MTTPTGVLFADPRVKPLSTIGQFQAGCYWCFFTTATTTPTNVYSDGALTTPLSQPVAGSVNPIGGTVAASDGRLVAVYLDPAVTYRVQLYSAAGVKLEDTDPYVVPGGANSITQAAVGAALYPRTADEVAVGVTPANYFWPEGYVDRYGTNTTPGTTDMTTAFNNAIAVVKYGGKIVRYGATWPYLVTAPLDCTCDSVANNGRETGYTIRNEGNIVAETQNAPFYPSVIAKHTGVAVFDCSGAFGINFENVSIGTDATTYPKTAWLLARNSDGSSQQHRFNYCRTEGSFSVSVVYNYASEDTVWTGCQLLNNAQVSGTKVVYITAHNQAGLASPYITIATGTQSCVNHQFIGGVYANFFGASGGGTTDVWYLDNCQSVKIIAPWTKCGIEGGYGGRSLIYVDTTNGFSDYCTVLGLQNEHATGTQQVNYGLYVSNDTSVTVTGFTLIGGVWDNQTSAIFSGASITLANFFVSNLFEATSHGMNSAGTVADSQLFGLGAATIGTALRCAITGQYSGGGYSITTLTDTIIQDTWAGAIIAKGSVTTGGNLSAGGGLGVFGNAAAAQVSGFGTPVGAAVISNYNITDAGGSNSNTNKCVAQILTLLKAVGLIAA